MEPGFEYDSSKTGLDAFFKEYQILSLQVVGEHPEGIRSRDIWLEVNNRLKDRTISRASIIIFLEDVHERGILKVEMTSGKGGTFPLYSMTMSESEFKTFLAKHLIEALLRDFPKAAKEAIIKIS